MMNGIPLCTFGKSVRTLAALLALGSLAAASQIAHAEDIAVVVGINEYTHLEGANLQGCVNDANLMKSVLESKGFKVVLLTNGQATKSGILKALDDAKVRVQGTDRFVFYFAGHGTHDPSYHCMLLTADAEETNYEHTLDKSDIASKVSAITARSRTVLLDACNSEGAFRGKGLHPFRSRYHRLRGNGANPKRLPVVNQTDSTDDMIDQGFCGYAACLRNQFAGEREIGDQTHGIFTYFLTDEIAKARKETPWDDVVTKVSAKVATEMEGQQTPIFGPNVYRSRSVFDGKVDPPKPHPNPNPRPIWDDFVDNKQNVRYVKVRLTPDRSSFKVGEKFDVVIEAGEEGYLVVLNKDFSDKVYLFSPNPTQGASVDDLVAAAKVSQGTTRTIHTAAVDKGTERVKAILFHSEEDARGLIALIPKDGATESQLRGLRRLPHQGQNDGNGWSYYTSMVETNIVGQDGKGSNDDDDNGSALLRTNSDIQVADKPNLPASKAKNSKVSLLADPRRSFARIRKGDAHA